MGGRERGAQWKDSQDHGPAGLWRLGPQSCRTRGAERNRQKAAKVGDSVALPGRQCARDGARRRGSARQPRTRVYPPLKGPAGSAGRPPALGQESPGHLHGRELRRGTRGEGGSSSGRQKGTAPTTAPGTG